MFKKLKAKLMGSKVMTMALTAMVALMAIPVAASASTPDKSLDLSGGAGMGFGFNVMDIIKTAWSFISQFDAFTIFVLALIVVPTLVGFVIWIVSKLPKFSKRSA